MFIESRIWKGVLNARQAIFLVTVFCSLVVELALFVWLVTANNLVLAGVTVLIWFFGFKVLMALFGSRIKEWTKKV